MNFIWNVILDVYQSCDKSFLKLNKSSRLTSPGPHEQPLICICGAPGWGGAERHQKMCNQKLCCAVFTYKYWSSTCWWTADQRRRLLNGDHILCYLDKIWLHDTVWQFSVHSEMILRQFNLRLEVGWQLFHQRFSSLLFPQDLCMSHSEQASDMMKVVADCKGNPEW